MFYGSQIAVCLRQNHRGLSGTWSFPERWFTWDYWRPGNVSDKWRILDAQRRFFLIYRLASLWDCPRNWYYNMLKRIGFLKSEGSMCRMARPGGLDQWWILWWHKPGHWTWLWWRWLLQEQRSRLHLLLGRILLVYQNKHQWMFRWMHCPFSIFILIPESM